MTIMNLFLKDIGKMRKLFYIFLCIIISSHCYSQVKEFTQRIDSLIKPRLMEQADLLIKNRDTILNRDSLKVFPLYMFSQDINNMKREKYLDYSFLDSLKWNFAKNIYSSAIYYPAELMVTDLDGNLRCLFPHGIDNSENLWSNSFYAQHTDSYGNEVLKRLVIHLLNDGIFDYAFVVSVPVVEKRDSRVYQQGRYGMCFCVKNEQVYVLYQDHKIYTMKEFVDLYWDWFDWKVSDTYSD